MVKPDQEGPLKTETTEQGEKILALEKEVERLNRAAACTKRRNKKNNRKAAEIEELKLYQAELILLQNYLEEKKRRLIVVFEGRDASGKGGTIRRVIRYMNDKHCGIVALQKPTEIEKDQWFFQRYVKCLPSGGNIALFDRSWYNRAVVEPIFNFCTPVQYKDFMRGVVPFEQELVRRDTTLVKLYFSVTKEEQARRFDRRENDPLRSWKLSEVDRQVQELWDEFTVKKHSMLKYTHTPETPWHIIRSNDKHKARLNAMRVILNAVGYDKTSSSDVVFLPDREIVVSGAHELELMDDERMRLGNFTE